MKDDPAHSTENIFSDDCIILFLGVPNEKRMLVWLAEDDAAEGSLVGEERVY